MKTIYRGWEDCYQLENSHLKVLINASAGGRIMVFERDGFNVIYENPAQDGKLLQDYRKEGFDPDGGRFDYGQEHVTRDIHEITWMGPWTAEAGINDSLKIKSLPDTNMGIQSERIFIPDPKHPRLRIIQRMKNISPKDTSWFFWGRTLVKLGGKFFIPLNPESKLPQKWGRYIWGNPDTFAADPDDKGVIIGDSFFSLIPENSANQKYGLDSRAGWMAYGIEGLLFVKKYKWFSEMKYSELFALTNIFYTNHKSFAEMEPVSPEAILKPGESFTYEEDWFILPYKAAGTKDFIVSVAAEFLNAEIAEISKSELINPF